MLIIDEATFIHNIGEIWASAQQTLATGGGCIALSTPYGTGNWFHQMWVSAEMGDTPIRSDEDLANLGLDALSLIPAAKAYIPIKNRLSRGIQPTPPPKFQQWMADESRFPGLQVTSKGKPGAPASSITVADKRVTGPGNYVRAVRNPKTGNYTFQFDMADAANPRRAGLAMQLLKNQFTRGTGFKETSTMSLDSYRNLLGMTRNPGYSFVPSGRTVLNTQAANAKFLDDLADPYISNWDDYANYSPARQARIDAWDAAGSKMMFSSKKAAQEAADRINNQYLQRFNITDQATPIKGDGRKWNVSIPNFQFTQKLTGGSIKVRIKK